MKKTEYYLVWAIIVLAVLIIGYLGSRTVGNLYYNRLMSSESALGEFQKHYQEKIALETDSYELAKMGMTFLKSDENELALECFKRATQMDPNWRDGWVWKGYAELKLNKPQDALTSLKTAEKIDPIYPLTYQLLVLAYQKNGDKENAQSAQAKLVYLSKSYRK